MRGVPHVADRRLEEQWWWPGHGGGGGSIYVCVRACTVGMVGVLRCCGVDVELVILLRQLIKSYILQIIYKTPNFY